MFSFQLFFLLISRGTLDACVNPSDAVRVEVEAAFASGCVVVPVHWFVARTTDGSVRPAWVNQRPAGVSAAEHKSAIAMWQRLYASQGTLNRPHAGRTTWHARICTSHSTSVSLSPVSLLFPPVAQPSS